MSIRPAVGGTSPGSSIAESILFRGFEQEGNRPNHFTVVEVWKDAKAVEAHSMAAATRQFRDKLATMTGALYDERKYALRE
jgi:quinol monooxygenase YgiN